MRAIVGIEHQHKLIEIQSEEVLVANPAGLHARPASVLARAAKKYRCNIRIIHGCCEANAKSMVSLMALGVERGSMVSVFAMGIDATDAVQDLCALIKGGCGDTLPTGS